MFFGGGAVGETTALADVDILFGERLQISASARWLAAMDGVHRAALRFVELRELGWWGSRNGRCDGAALESDMISDAPQHSNGGVGRDCDA